MTITREREIWGVASLLIQQHGDNAFREAVRLGDRIREASVPDPAGVAFWESVENAVLQMQALPDGSRH